MWPTDWASAGVTTRTLQAHVASHLPLWGGALLLYPAPFHAPSSLRIKLPPPPPASTPWASPSSLGVDWCLVFHQVGYLGAASHQLRSRELGAEQWMAVDLRLKLKSPCAGLVSDTWFWNIGWNICLQILCLPFHFWAQGSAKFPWEKRCENPVHEGLQRHLYDPVPGFPEGLPPVAFGLCPSQAWPSLRAMTDCTSIIFHWFLLMFLQIQNLVGSELMSFSWFQLSHQDGVWQIMCDYI